MVNESHPSGAPFPSDTSHGFSYAAPHDGGPYEQAGFDIYAQQGAQQGYSHEYDAYSTGGYDNNFAPSYGDASYSDPSYGDAPYGDGDPLFGSMPGSEQGSYATGGYDAYAGQAGYAESGYDAGAWTNTGYPMTADVPAQPGAEQGDYGYASGQWDASQWETGQWDASQWESGQWDAGQWESPADDGSWGTAAQDTGHAPDVDHSAATYDGYAYDDATQQYEVPGHYEESYESHEGHEPVAAEGYGAYEQQTAYDEPFAHDVDMDATAAFPSFDGLNAAPAASSESRGPVDAEHDSVPDITPAAARVGGAPHPRSRRRSPRPRRSALLTVAVPSVCVMGVAGAAAASVVGNNPDDRHDHRRLRQPTPPVKPVNSKLDTQLAGLSADADDFADRASRTQERIDLKAAPGGGAEAQGEGGRAQGGAAPQVRAAGQGARPQRPVRPGRASTGCPCTPGSTSRSATAPP